MTQMNLTLFAKPEASAGDVNTSSVALRELTRKSGPLKEPQGMLFFSVVLLLNHTEDVLGVHDPVLLSVELDLRPRRSPSRRSRTRPPRRPLRPGASAGLCREALCPKQSSPQARPP